MEWSMQNSAFKVNLFRLIDVLPTLTSAKAIGSHIEEYLSKEARALHPILGWMFTVEKSLIKRSVASVVTKKSVLNMANDFIAGDSAKSALPVLKAMRADTLAFTVDLLGEYCVPHWLGLIVRLPNRLG
jgi:RHH-type proline utilization regulon transcriptional repressor/proline dehydrogenase/delta 1-pyrroline-5-carboxylate dehydrogenase